MDISAQLYATHRGVTIDRSKPVHARSELLVWDNKCNAQDAEWECIPYAYASCEQYRGTDGYLQCVDDRFRACRSAAGCDYRYNTSPGTCVSTPRSQNLAFSEAVELVCNDPSKEFPSPESYNACVDRMWEWSQHGCASLSPNEVSGAVVGSTGW